MESSWPKRFPKRSLTPCACSRRPPRRRAELDGVLDALGSEEVQVLIRLAERLKLGRRSYGPLQLACDTRAFRSKEAREELEDALVYLACAWLKSETQEVNG
jgi:hypothetical protein